MARNQKLLSWSAIVLISLGFTFLGYQSGLSETNDLSTTSIIRKQIFENENTKDESLLLNITKSLGSIQERLNTIESRLQAKQLPSELESRENIKYKAVNKNPDRLCKQNPFIPALNNTLEEISENVLKYAQHKQKLIRDLITRSHNTINHVRFDAFQEMSRCSQSCVGGSCRADKSKIVCGFSALFHIEKCVVYSIGSNNHWEFEKSILKKTNCEVYTFDCTGLKSRFTPPTNDRLHFHHICLGAEYVPASNRTTDVKSNEIVGQIMTLHQIQKKFHHDKIDLLKMDIEGYEWSVFDSFPTLETAESLDFVLPFQILVEIHYLQAFTTGRHSRYYETDLVNLATRLHDMGYATIVRDNNRMCQYCSELTLIRFKCPN